MYDQRPEDITWQLNTNDLKNKLKEFDALSRDLKTLDQSKNTVSEDGSQKSS